MANSFDYVRFDEKAKSDQAAFKEHFSALEELTYKRLAPTQTATWARVKLEEAYMWVGKCIRNDQITRCNGRYSLQDEPNDKPDDGDEVKVRDPVDGGCEKNEELASHGKKGF